jgi:C-terminal processing protease CtpA/Prc
MAQTFDCVLDLSRRGLGIQVAGGADDGGNGVFVVEVDQAGAAAAAGIQANDQINTANGIAMTPLTHEEVVAHLSGLRGQIKLTVTRVKDLVINIDPDVETAAATATNGKKTVRERPGARPAFRQGDVELSRVAHDTAIVKAKESHNTYGG